MKKVFLMFFMLILSLSATVQADEAVAYVYSTDIIAFVNNIPVNSYNIGGKTVVVAEDLDTLDVNYGFDVSYHEESRMLNINSNGFTRGSIEIEKGTVGEIIGEVYKTDIKVFVNSFEVTGYNFGGKTAVCLEELGFVDETSPNREYGYSKYMCNSQWDSDNRIVTLNSYQSERDYMGQKLVYTFNDNVLSVTFDQLNNYDNRICINFSDEFLLETYKIKDVFYSVTGEKIGTMYISSNGNYFADFDNEKLKGITTSIEEMLTYEEAVRYIEDGYSVLNMLETENAKVYLVQKNDMKYLFLAMKKGKCGLVKADEFSSQYTKVELTGLNDNGCDFGVKVYPFGGLHGTVEATFAYGSDYYIR